MRKKRGVASILFGAFPKFTKNDKNVEASLGNKYFYSRFVTTARRPAAIEVNVSTWEGNMLTVSGNAAM